MFLDLHSFLFPFRLYIFIFLSPLAQILVGLGIYIIMLETEHCYHNVSDTDSPYVQKQWAIHHRVPSHVHTGPHVSESRSHIREDKLERYICPARQGKGILLNPPFKLLFIRLW